MKNKSRFFIVCAYLGTNYVGWQRQPNGISIQEEIEKGLSVLYQEEIKIHGSSRTDAGVHAKKQVAHVDLPFSSFSSNDIIHRLNNLLPPDISLHQLVAVEDDVHARFAAIGRRYTYRLHAHKDPFEKHHAYYFRPDLNVELMNEAAKLLLTNRNFQCFSKVKTTVNNFLCEVSLAEWKNSEHHVTFTITANRFLRGMVRAIVGTLLEIGQGKMAIEQFQEILTSQNRAFAGRNVPPIGLTLEEVIYPWEDIKKN